MKLHELTDLFHKVWGDCPGDAVPFFSDIERFAGLVVAHTLANIDSFNKASYQEGYNAGIEGANKRHCEVLKHFRDTVLLQERVNSLRTRSKA